jgi:hypothetical protein
VPHCQLEGGGEETYVASARSSDPLMQPAAEGHEEVWQVAV